MPTTATAELYFIAGAFVLILLICAVSVYVFFRQLKREKGREGTEVQSTAAERSEKTEEEGE